MFCIKALLHWVMTNGERHLNRILFRSQRCCTLEG